MEVKKEHLNHLKAAKICLRREQYGDAMAHFVFLAHVEPSLKPSFEEEFAIALRHWMELLESRQELDKLFVCIQESLKLYSESVTILNNTGATLLKFGFTDQAASCFRKALQVEPRNERARENLESVANLLVERWHFRMLNDKKRNVAYKEAITKAIGKGHDIVLDIGSGSGILSMFAVQSGAKEVYACEMSKTLYEMAHDVLKANCMENSIHMVHKKSTELEIGKDIPQRVSLVVTETLDCGLLGEGILSTIEHAWNNLLIAPEPCSSGMNEVSKVIPAGAVIYAVLIMCEDIKNHTVIKPLICGISVPQRSIIGGERMPQKDDNKCSKTNFNPLEPYSTESLRSLRGGFTHLSHPFKVAEYAFNNPGSLHEDKVMDFKVPAIQAGRLDAIAVWFDLHLDEEITLSTGPEDDSLCWEQAIFPVYSCYSEAPSVSSLVAKGDTISITGCLSQECLRFEVLGVKTSGSTQEGCEVPVVEAELEEADGATSHRFLTEQMTVIPPSYMRRLNDEVFSDTFNMAISDAVHKIKTLTSLTYPSNNYSDQTSKNSNVCKVLDVTYGPTLSVFFAARAGADCVLIANPFEIAWLKCILLGNGLPSVTEYGPVKLEEIAKHGRMWSILVSDIVEPSGVMRQQVIEDVVFSRGCLLSEENFQVIPMGFTVHCMCIESQFLLANCHVLSQDRTLGLDIGQFMNEFQVTTHLDIDLATLSFVAVTDQVKLFSLDFKQRFQDEHQLLSLLETRTEQRIKVTKSGTVHAIPYWFSLHISRSHSLSTYSEAYLGSHWRQAVIVLREELPVKAGQELLLMASCINSSISIELKVIKE